ALFLWIWEQVVRSIQANPWLWIITFVVLVCAVIATVAWWSTRSNLEIKKRLMTVDERLLRSLPSLMTASDLKDSMSRFVKELLLPGLGNVFNGDVTKVSLFLPDPTADRKSLIRWNDYPKPVDNQSRRKFDISKDGQDGLPRGLAAKVYMNGEPIIAHLSMKKDHFSSDVDCYLVFDKERDRGYLPYRSRVCVRLNTGEDENERLGVICFDSPHSRTFDSPEMRQLLLDIARRVASVISVYQALETGDRKVHVA